jgi:HEAT repeat protein
VLDAIEAVATHKDRRARKGVLALREHPSGWVRGDVLRYLQRCYPTEAVPAALAALTDPHYVVRESAIDVLDELDIAATYQQRIRLLLGDPHPHVRQAAQWALESAHAWKVERPEEM